MKKVDFNKLQAGNSIPVPIFESIFRKILLGETEERQRGGE